MNHIILSRTDSIGDVMLTLPVAGFLRQKFPDAKITFIARSYTKAIINACTHVDQFLDKDVIIEDPQCMKSLNADVIIFLFPDRTVAKAAKKAGIPLRIGTSHRLFHWFYCNKLVHFSRKRSDLHEALLNFKLLEPVIGKVNIRKEEVPTLYGMSAPDLNVPFNKEEYLHKNSVILHPKSKGSAREWPLTHYKELIRLLPQEHYQFYVTGTREEGEQIRTIDPDFFSSFSNVTDLTGKLTLEQLITTINQADSLVACSTGPLHIAAALGKQAVGIYPPMKPIHPGRWAALGNHVSIMVLKKECSDCRKSNHCVCINAILPGEVGAEIQKVHG